MSTFDGPVGAVAATVMRWMNVDMERAGLDRLDPHDGDRLLVIGFGPGVGLIDLLDRCRPASVTAIDPSSVMVSTAKRRLRRHPLRDAVTVIQATADEVELRPASLDGAIAINTQQLWQPQLATALLVAASLRPGGRLATVTHEWAVAKSTPVAEWKATVESDLLSAGFVGVSWRCDNYRSGRGLTLETSRTRDKQEMTSTRE